ncbi:MAG: DUF523 domain-containing protein [Gammaproteobacteria bacterium]|nr:DUF523 domain-containing protein [Gammaproteobacteria bacterium]
MTDKPVVAVSACLLGHRVRYDGREKKHSLIVDSFLNKFSDKVELVPFCPEVAIGLSVPRAKIQVVKETHEQIRLVGVEDHRLDVTQPLKLYAESFLQQYPDIRGFIVKSKSPSCGFQSTPLFERLAQEKGSCEEHAEGTLPNAEGSYKQLGFTSGLFVQSVLILKPGLQIIEETQLTTENACLNFIQNLKT